MKTVFLKESRFGLEGGGGCIRDDSEVGEVRNGVSGGTISRLENDGKEDVL